MHFLCFYERTVSVIDYVILKEWQRVELVEAYRLAEPM